MPKVWTLMLVLCVSEARCVKGEDSLLPPNEVEPMNAMPKALETIKPAVRGLRAYTLSPDRASIKINQNENPWDAPALIREETLRRLSARPWSRYPDFVPASLHERLAAFAGWQEAGIIAGNGSNELIQALLLVTVGLGKKVLISEPTFALYRQITTVLGGHVHTVALNSDLQYDAGKLRETIDEIHPDVTIICSPNNPTGCLISDPDLAMLLQASPGIVVVDEAYHEFAEHSVVPLLNDHNNLVVLRTFSKAMALAALRVGYLLAAPALTREIAKAVLPYNLNAFSQTAAEVAVDLYETALLPLVTKIRQERERLFLGINSIDGLNAIRSRANFMVAGSQMDPKQVFAELLERDILIRDVSSYPMLSSYFRASVGRPEENDRLIAALKEIFKQAAA
jgi:histidinol-phosphate aminotransferase